MIHIHNRIDILDIKFFLFLEILYLKLTFVKTFSQWFIHLKVHYNLDCVKGAV